MDGATNKASPKILCIFLLFLLAIMLLTLVPKDIVSGSETIEIVRDYWGIPHIFASSSEGVFYGLGYATAQDRMFQMEYSRRIVEGRISELVEEKGLQSDKHNQPLLPAITYANRISDPNWISNPDPNSGTSPLYIIMGVVLILAAIAFVGLLLLRKK